MDRCRCARGCRGVARPTSLRDSNPFHYPLAHPVGNTTFAPTEERRIPPYVHYVFGLSPPSPKNEFNFIHYLCLTSALVELKPQIVYFHYRFEPTSWYWSRFKLEVERSETTRLEMVQERDVTEVFGNPVEHYAHKADVLRLEALQKYGGVYLDADVLVVRGEFSVPVSMGVGPTAFSLQRS